MGLPRDWGLAGLFFMLSAGAYWYEQTVITPAEEVEAQVYGLIEDCIDNNTDQVLSRISAQQFMLQTQTVAGLALVDIEEDMHVTDLSVRMLAQNTRAISHFRANGSVSMRQVSHSNHVATRWELTWQQEADEWKIVKIERLNPITGDKMPLLKQAET